jgi:serine/threonine-protein kinase
MIGDSLGRVKSCPACKSNFPAKTPRCPLDGSALVDLGPDLLAGRVVAGRYRFVDRCGAGAVAEVYRTHDVRPGVMVAARVQSPALVGDPWYRARLQDQVRSFHRVAPHDALVPVLDVVDGGAAARTLVVTEFIATPALPQLLLGGPVPLAAALDAGVQLAALLEHLHARDVLARDLRAGAVFLPVSAGAKVRMTIEALATGPTCSPDPVPPLQGGSAHVAAGYVSPERARGEPGAAAGDIYALGALLFEMCTGRPVFQGSVREVAQAHVQSPPPVLRAVSPAMPEAVEALLMRMFAKVPRFRPTALEVRSELSAARAALT